MFDRITLVLSLLVDIHPSLSPLGFHAKGLPCVDTLVGHKWYWLCDYILLSDSDVCLALCCIVASRGHATKPCQIQKKLSPSLFNLRFCRVLQLQVTPAVFLYNRRPATCAIYKDHARRIQFGRCRLKEANEEFKETRWSGGKLIPKFWHSWYTIETYRIIPFSLTWELRYWQTAPKNWFGTKRHNKFIQIFWSLAPHWM